MKPIPCIASGERTSIPSSTPHHVKANIASTISASSSTACGGVSCGFQPRISPNDDDDHHPEHLLAELAHHLAADDRQAADRHRAKAIDDALGHVVRRRDAGADHPERQRLADDPREHVVLVADPRHVDRRAEHVQEQQDEHDRLDRHVEQPLGHARDRAQAAPGQQRRVAHELQRSAAAARRRWLRSRSCGGLLVVVRTRSRDR